ncbi:hypothetical protein AKJ57_03045 [candidate division MSBL1 archaeon SCGC-AAA259A05]|uniref:Phosphoglucosamine mutase n=1 Tax=candidate division MSBL1 archaeon SCGC-AAA259A05 TaxID=1698259 RepID=A0A133U9Y4_9EURY|nr:hypothetical protein AKJ57_03045 [candidate division MSBL1 archaeon SCGC-AAA259A05]
MSKLFGTFGIRGIANEEISPDLANQLGLALATHLGGEGRVSVGYDPRTSSEMLERAMVAGLTSGGCDAIRLGMVPTPVLSFGTKRFSCDAGIMITASHNPPEYNGIKFWDGEGAGFVRERENEIEDIYESGGKLADWNQIGDPKKEDATTPYRKAIDDRVQELDKKLKVVVDCANGAGSEIAPRILTDLGCRVISMNSQPDGHFPGRLPEPTEEHISGLIQAVTSMDADLGVAHDGDADRTIIVDENGSVLSGDRVFALAATNYLEGKKNPRIITTVATSSVLEDVAERLGGTVVRTRVGEPELVREFRENGGDLAGEENGGVIFPDWVMCRDGIMTAVQFIDYVARRGKTVSELNETLPEYKQLKKKIECPDELKGEVLDDLAQKFEDYDLDRTDGMRIVFDDGWLIMRPSGTEPIFRCFSEAKTGDGAEELVERGMGALEDSIESLKERE